LWDWALAAYARPGAQEACLALQDRFDQSVPLLLFAAWSAATGRPLAAETLEAAADTARAYEAAIVRPLRGVRRTLKAALPDIDDAAREALRDQVKALELEAERRLIEGLAALAAAPEAPPRQVLDGLVAAARVWSRVTPRADLERLAATLSH
jgi:uncharacterized protein (TIGR02444 family)